MIALSAKTYYGHGSTDKFSTKGIQRNAGTTLEDFRHVLDTRESVKKTNIGFMMKDKHMMTYEMTRSGLGYAYFKRIVQEDGISTAPLNL